MSRIAFHLSHPTVSLESYVRQKRVELGAKVASMQRVYLDLRFWIFFREVSLGQRNDGAIADLLAFLRSSVREGSLICPISESVFIELLKQSDDTTRLATAQLIDELSLGVTLIPFDDRVRQELCNSFYEHAGATDLIPIDELVWTKLVYVLGEVHPSSTPFPADEELALQKAFCDHVWNITLAEMASQLGALPLEPDWDATARNLNAGNKTHRSTLRSYTHAFRIEFEGALSLFREEMTLLARAVAQRGYLDFGKKLADLSQNKRLEAFARTVPTLHITAACHAGVRWDQQRKLDGNDLFDFHHAQAALAYCDVFLTEKPLSHMLGQRHLGLTEYRCQTFWSPSSALEWLRRNHS